MATYVEDLDTALSPIEDQLVAGLSFAKLERLRLPAMKAMLTEQNPGAQARRMVQLAASLEPGALFNGYFNEVYLASCFRSKRRLLGVDSLLAPYYGLVTGSMTELRNAGIDPAITDMWLYHFRQDNAHYRAQVVASMCVVGAFSDVGLTVGV
jgi:hypothetical protein